MKIIFLLLGITITCTESFSQAVTESIKTDRPDQTESPSTTPPQYFQIEIGSLIASDKTRYYSENIFLMPTMLTKYGISKTVELRLITELAGLVQTMYNDRKFASGFKPVLVGFKINLFQENRKKFIPKTSFVGHLGIARLSSDFFETHRSFPQFRFLMEHALSQKTSMGYNIGMEWNGFSNNPSTIYTLSMARDLGKGVGTFAEVYGSFSRYDLPNKIIGDHRFDAGFTYLLNHNFQFDVSGGLGLTTNAPDYFVSTGISFRFKK